MFRKIISMTLALLACFLPVVQANADEDIHAQFRALKATVASQQKSIERLRSENNENWLNERRAEEIKTLMHDVLTDADTRASLLADGATAGYDKHFFIASNDGTFLLQTSFKLQTRYIFNHADQATGTDENEGGFQQRRDRKSVV